MFCKLGVVCGFNKELLEELLEELLAAGFSESVGANPNKSGILEAQTGSIPNAPVNICEILTSSEQPRIKYVYLLGKFN